MAQKAAKVRQTSKLWSFKAPWSCTFGVVWCFKRTHFRLSCVFEKIMPDRTRLLPLFLLAFYPLNGSVITDALKSELTRSMEHLKKQPMPPYFLSYELIAT